LRAGDIRVDLQIMSNVEPQVLDDNRGERMVPEVSGSPVYWQHLYRYNFASRFVRGKRILDIACGEGYGAAALQKAGAAHITGVDISEGTCHHARRKYGIDVRVGSAEQIPLPVASVDTIVSFETIEHVPNPLRFLDECTRVLTPGGTLIISTPNKQVYSAPGQPVNPYHCSEMTEDEFLSTLGTNFFNIKLYSQHPYWAAWWSLRTLAADKSPWDQVHLFQRLRQSARFRLAPRSVYDPSPEERSATTEHILNVGRPGPSVLIPFVVRPYHRWTGEQPFYFVAVATSKGQSRKDA
jgi:SAM-dependent methyltransferase